MVTKHFHKRGAPLKDFYANNTLWRSSFVKKRSPKEDHFYKRGASQKYGYKAKLWLQSIFTKEEPKRGAFQVHKKGAS